MLSLKTRRAAKMRYASLLSAAFVSFVFVAGCGKDSVTDSATEQAASTPPAATTGLAPNTEAVTQAATDFLDAVLKGDTQRASARLTPRSMERIIESGKQFAPPGLETASFRIGQIRMPSANHALVQCILTDTSTPGSPRNEEMCCLLKLVEDDWRVSGIAYGTGGNQPWTLSDFETGKSTAIPRPGAGRSNASQQAGVSTRPSPPRTAQEQPAGVVR
jgi:hypothetical protein